MGFFSKPEDINPAGEPVGGAPQISRERIEAALKANDWNYSIDSDGDIGGNWDGHGFYFFLYGEKKEIMQTRGRWSQKLPASLKPQVLEVLNDWHIERIWPKGYARVDDKGDLWVYAEHSVDFEAGVSDELLQLTIQCGISTSLQMFNHLAEKFPITVSPDTAI